MEVLVFVYKRRLTLLKSILSNVFIYYLSLFVIPKRVHMRLKMIKKECWWQVSFLEKKPHLVNSYTMYLDDKIKLKMEALT